MRSHSVTCHPTKVNAPRHNPSQPGWYSIYLSQKDGRLSRPRYLESGPTRSQVRHPNCYATEFSVELIPD